MYLQHFIAPVYLPLTVSRGTAISAARQDRGNDLLGPAGTAQINQSARNCQLARKLRRFAYVRGQVFFRRRQFQCRAAFIQHPPFEERRSKERISPIHIVRAGRIMSRHQTDRFCQFRVWPRVHRSAGGGRSADKTPGAPALIAARKWSALKCTTAIQQSRSVAYGSPRWSRERVSSVTKRVESIMSLPASSSGCKTSENTSSVGKSGCSREPTWIRIELASSPSRYNPKR